MSSGPVPPGALEHRFLVEEEEAGDRIDRFVANLSGESRNRIQNLLSEGWVTVDGRVPRASRRLREGELVALVIPSPRPLDLVPADIPLQVIHEDDALIVVDKAAGLVVHPAPGHRDDTLVNALLGRGTRLSGIGGQLRPGVVHRLDRDTSGLMVVAKGDQAHQSLSRQFAERTIDREYQALMVRLRGPEPQASGTFDTLHGRHPNDRKRFSTTVSRGRRAVTHYAVRERIGDQVIEVTCRLETGRTHQIRVHFADAGWPLLGDRVYGGRAMRDCRLLDRQALHARRLGFDHPTMSERLVFEVEPPADYRAAAEALRGGASWR